MALMQGIHRVVSAASIMDEIKEGKSNRVQSKERINFQLCEYGASILDLDDDII